MPMHTRRHSLYPENSMAIDTMIDSMAINTMIESTSDTLTPPRNLKRIRTPENERMIPTWDFVTSPLFRNSKKQNDICEGENKPEQWMNGKMKSYEKICAVNLARKRRKKSTNYNEMEPNMLDILPDDLIIDIMGKLSVSANSASDIWNARLACKKFNELLQLPWVLARTSTRSLPMRAKLWSESAHRYMKRCADIGNLEACYILGMIYFYCLEKRSDGASYMAKAAMGSHPSALYSLAIIQFNGSGGTKADKNLRAGVTLCARAAHLGHVDAVRELGHCLQDGYGIRRHVEEGRRLLTKASRLELASVLSHLRQESGCKVVCKNGSKFLELSCIPVFDPHPANQFLVEWLASRAGKGEAREDGTRACTHLMCGRVETRRHEFRRCSVCGKANYCSRACQAMDWKRVHRVDCVPPDAGAPPVGELVQLVG
ncbi:F-box protein [Carex littledalei]|uniref:F-box protein n=1 Tax=Carex littledalei TaxID=544730 RepID=A0A833RJU1_9POAL|nr:F-box protein [Carex littledalei]